MGGFIRRIVGWIGASLLKWANPDQAAQVDKFLADAKAQDAKAEEVKTVVAGEEAKVTELTKVEEDAGARQASSEAAADETDTELNEALKPKAVEPRGDDDELRHLSERL